MGRGYRHGGTLAARGGAARGPSAAAGGGRLGGHDGGSRGRVDRRGDHPSPVTLPKGWLLHSSLTPPLSAVRGRLHQPAPHRRERRSEGRMQQPTFRKGYGRRMISATIDATARAAIVTTQPAATSSSTWSSRRSTSRSERPAMTVPPSHRAVTVATRTPSRGCQVTMFGASTAACSRTPEGGTGSAPSSRPLLARTPPVASYTTTNDARLAATSTI